MLTLHQTWFQDAENTAVSKTTSLGSGKWEAIKNQQVMRQANKTDELGTLWAGRRETEEEVREGSEGLRSHNEEFGIYAWQEDLEAF